MTLARFASAPCLSMMVAAALVVAACGGPKAEQKGAGGRAGSGPVALPALHAAGLATSSRSDPQVTDGARVYAKYCALCHGNDAKGYAADHAPSLVSQSFLESVSDEFLVSSIRGGRPGTAMAAYAQDRGGPLSDGEVSALVSFLRAQGPAPVPPVPSPGKGDVLLGQLVYDATCQRCHGTPQLRGEAVHLANPAFLAAASDAFLRHAIVSGRQGTPMVSFAGKLEDRQIDDVVALLRSWAPFQAPAASVVAQPLPPPLPPVINPKGAAATVPLREERFVAIDQFKKAFDARKRMVIIDARASSEWLTLRIPGSISVPYYELAGLDAVPNDGTWVFAYCACPHHASGVIVDELRKRGFKNTAILDEGVLEWSKRKYPVAGSGAPPAASVGRLR